MRLFFQEYKMLDINIFRPDRGADLEVVRASQRARFADESLVDKVHDLDSRGRQASHTRGQLSKEFNDLNKEIASFKKANQATTHLQERSKELKKQVEQEAALETELLVARDELLSRIGNLVHQSVPVHRSEEQNEVVHESDLHRRGMDQQELRSHPDLTHMLGVADLETGASVSGTRGYFLMHEGVLLNQALVSYGLHFLSQRGFLPVQTPYWLQRDVMAQCAQLSQFDDELYRVSAGDEAPFTAGGRVNSSLGASTSDSSNVSHGSASSSSGKSSKDRSCGVSTAASSSTGSKYLIATSEQALCALHANQWLESVDLPLCYAGLSTCFRREAGSHGKDTLGIFRVHQFDKVEQFAITHPGGGASWAMLDSLVGNARDFYTSLGLPHRLVRIVSGALNLSTAAKIDLEGWFPASKSYRELVSASNCTDYQSRKLNVRLRDVQGAAKQRQQQEANGSASHNSSSSRSSHPHMLNCTLAATQRTLCCIMENYQTHEGIKVPPVLQPYMHGQDFIPFRRTLAQTGLLVSSALRHAR